MNNPLPRIKKIVAFQNLQDIFTQQTKSLNPTNNTATHQQSMIRKPCSKDLLANTIKPAASTL